MDATTATSTPSHESARNIFELNAISSQIPTLLSTAGTAIQSLTNTTPENPNPTITARKATFTTQTQTFYTTLHALRTSLLSQVSALEKAELISAYPPDEYGGGIKNGGLGDLDIGYLNGRGRDVGVGKESEIVREGRVVLERIVRGEGKRDKGDAEEDGDEKMED
ncbi:hypothetical protein EJ08DRAFT_270188 [Tothia fuscella]|uniref:Mediator of RNA polymerase II transcription subunit 11 n=1 Tax=Tothia fuscella TaxID=1048955 RepID=A0A9P4TXU5_9PEZI|nr:hypothetical protein EJ08DRAFT_270188 [Tothia fuscella]